MPGLEKDFTRGSPDDQIALRELVTLYCRAIDRRDTALLRSIYTPDVEFDFTPNYVGDLEPWLAFLEQALADFDMMQHNVTNSFFRIRGDEAEGETYVIAFHTFRSKPGAYLAGARYLDRFRRTHAGWRISQRTAPIDWRFRTELAGLEADTSREGQRDPSYAVFGMFAGAPL